MIRLGSGERIQASLLMPPDWLEMIKFPAPDEVEEVLHNPPVMATYPSLLLTRKLLKSTFLASIFPSIREGVDEISTFSWPTYKEGLALIRCFHSLSSF